MARLFQLCHAAKGLQPSFYWSEQQKTTYGSQSTRKEVRMDFSFRWTDPLSSLNEKGCEKKHQRRTWRTKDQRAVILHLFNQKMIKKKRTMWSRGRRRRYGRKRDVRSTCNKRRLQPSMPLRVRRLDREFHRGSCQDYHEYVDVQEKTWICDDWWKEYRLLLYFL